MTLQSRGWARRRPPRPAPHTVPRAPRTAAHGARHPVGLPPNGAAPTLAAGSLHAAVRRCRRGRGARHTLAAVPAAVPAAAPAAATARVRGRPLPAAPTRVAIRRPSTWPHSRRVPARHRARRSDPPARRSRRRHPRPTKLAHRRVRRRRCSAVAHAPSACAGGCSESTSRIRGPSAGCRAPRARHAVAWRSLAGSGRAHRVDGVPNRRASSVAARAWREGRRTGPSARRARRPTVPPPQSHPSNRSRAAPARDPVR